MSRNYKDIDLVSANVENIDLKDATTFIFEAFVKSNEHIIQKINHQKQTSNKKQQ